MSLPYPDELKHSNDNYALADVNSIRGKQTAADKTARNTIPADKRKFQCEVIVGTERHLYISADLSDTAWQNDGNWIVTKHGVYIADSIAERDAITAANRMKSAQVFIGSTRYTYMSNDVSDTEWIKPENWEEAATNKQVISSYKSIYVNNVSGSNIAGDGTSGNQYATLERALEDIENTVLGFTVAIFLQSSDTPYVVDFDYIKKILSTIDVTFAYDYALTIKGESVIVESTNITSSNHFEKSIDMSMISANEIRGYCIGSRSHILESNTDGSIVVCPEDGLTNGSNFVSRYGAIIKPTTAYGSNLTFDLGAGSSLVNFDNIIIETNTTAELLLKCSLTDCILRSVGGLSNARPIYDGSFQFNNLLLENFIIDTERKVYGNNLSVLSTDDFPSKTIIGGGSVIAGNLAVVGGECGIGVNSAGGVKIGGGYNDAYSAYFKNITGGIFRFLSNNGKISISGNKTLPVVCRGAQRLLTLDESDGENNNLFPFGCKLSLDKVILGDIPTNIEQPYIDLVKNTNINIPGVTDVAPTLVNDTVIGNFPTITFKHTDDIGFFKHVKVATIGSSSMEGAGAESYREIERQLIKFLDEKCESYELHQLAVGGYTSRNILPDWYGTPITTNNITHAVKRLEADIVVCFLASNDVNSGYSQTEMSQNWEYIYKEARAYNAKMIVMDVNPVDSWSADAAKQLDQIDQSVMLSSTYSENFIPHFADVANNDVTWISQYYSDGTHANRILHLKWGALIMQQLQKLMLLSANCESIEIYRKEAGSYELYAEIEPWQKEYIDTNTTALSSYDYKARYVVRGGTPMALSNELSIISQSTTKQSNYLNIDLYGNSSDPGVNNVSNSLGAIVALVDPDGNATPYSIENITGSGGTAGQYEYTKLNKRFWAGSLSRGFYNASDVEYDTLTISGFDANQDVTVHITGSKITLSSFYMSDYRVNGEVQQLWNAANHKNYKTFETQADADGKITIDYKASEGKSNGYLAAIVVKY